MTTLRVAFRNVFRNRRRSLMTMLTVAVGGVAVLLLGALISHILLDFQTSIVRRTGHLAIYRTGYFEFGTGNPAIYGIDGYERVLHLITHDPVLKPMIAVATSIQMVFGIAGNEQADVSKTFFGQGVAPHDRWLMRRWNDYEIVPPDPLDRPLPDNQIDIGIIGQGLARILGLCEPVHLPNCPRRPALQAPVQRADTAGIPESDFSGLIQQAGTDSAKMREHRDMPRLDLLAATANGAPNVVNFYVQHAEGQGIKEYDDSFIIMNLKLAQELVYGRGKHGATGIVLQLVHTNELDAARARLIHLFKANNLGLDIHDFRELTPLYKQVLAFFAFLFTFMALIIGVIALFTIVNTMTMNVMERTTEIGTMRALGITRIAIRRQFVVEGAVLGGLGATLGVVLAAIIVLLINGSGLTWTPPTAAGRIPLRLFLFGEPGMIAGTWLVLVVLSALASLVPASRAAKMPVVDALRHV